MTDIRNTYIRRKRQKKKPKRASEVREMEGSDAIKAKEGESFIKIMGPRYPMLKRRMLYPVGTFQPDSRSQSALQTGVSKA